MLSAPLAGLLGAALTVWVTFVPCLLWIFLGALSAALATMSSPCGVAGLVIEWPVAASLQTLSMPVTLGVTGVFGMLATFL